MNGCSECKWVFKGLPNKPSPIKDVLFLCTKDKQELGLSDLVRADWV